MTTDAGKRLLERPTRWGWREDVTERDIAAIEAEAVAADRAIVESALRSEDEIAHGEAILGGDTSDPRSHEGVGRCAYCGEPWPCRTQRGIDRLLDLIAAEPLASEEERTDAD